MSVSPHVSMPAARPRTGAGRIGFAGPLLACLLTAAGVVLLHDAVAEADRRPGRTWLAAVLDGLDGLTASWWMIPAGVAVAGAGVWLIVTAVRPRSRRTLAVTSATGVFLHVRDVARLASAAAEDVDGIRSARSVAGRRAVTVTVTSPDPEIAGRVQEAVERRLSVLEDPLPVTVRVRSGPLPKEDA
ncbi:DUF6286 domain-containing protein [Actinoplanes sp. NBRC 101535]|uniref:DUF6286 domain-containing protein n=1 Tax=Actinoplanes sp. NBRC 101535 TaxID=3032196 RepID=UPI0024A59FD1|nr:DUF6286 domain-containing protein [Actinoplanes sp. NBRC 101535]GLY06583.1 hypothetical protein Acsp01_69620 [Actinoplanes sp. NBRC 101535]